MPTKSDGIPSLGIIAMIATMFPEMSIVNRAMAAMYAEKSGFEVDQGGGLPALALVQEPVWVKTILNSMKMKTDGGGPEPVNIQTMLDAMMKLEDSQGGGLPAVLTQEPIEIQEVLNAMIGEMKTEDQDPGGGGLPEAQVVIPGTIMAEISGDKNHRYAGFDVQHQMFPAMEQEYFGMKTWQGSKLETSTQQSHHLATEISGRMMTGFGS